MDSTSALMHSLAALHLVCCLALLRLKNNHSISLRAQYRNGSSSQSPPSSSVCQKKFVDNSTVGSDLSQKRTTAYCRRKSERRLKTLSGSQKRQRKPRGLSEEERQTVQKMAARDAQIRAHENAHVAAAGGMASAPSYTYETGPKRQTICHWRKCEIDMSPEATPRNTQRGGTNSCSGDGAG